MRLIGHVFRDFTDTLEGLRRDHPDWNEDQLKAKAAAAGLPQDVLGVGQYGDAWLGSSVTGYRQSLRGSPLIQFCMEDIAAQRRRHNKESPT